MSTKRIISKLDQMNNFHFSQNCISLQFFEREGVYRQFVEVLEDVLHRANVRTLRLPFRKILSSDRRMVRLVKTFAGMRKTRRKHWFSRLLEYSFYQQKMYRDLRRFGVKLKKKRVLKSLLNLRFYFSCQDMVRRKFSLIRRILVTNRRQDFEHFFAQCRQLPAYEIPIANSPVFPFARSEDSEVTDRSTDRAKPPNIFNQDETSDSKHFSYNRLENVETFQGFCSKEENILKNSNFNTFYQPDKDAPAQEFQLNSYGTFNKISESWVRQASPCESIKNNLVEPKLVPIQDMGEELENESESDRVIGVSPGESLSLVKASSKVENKVVILGSGKLSQMSGKSDQASCSVEKKKKETNTYMVHVDQLLIGRKQPGFAKFDIDLEPRVEQTSPKKPKIHQHTNDFGSGDLESPEFDTPRAEPRLQSTRKITEKVDSGAPAQRNEGVLSILNSSTQTRKTRRARRRPQARQPADLIQKSKSQARLKPKTKLNKSTRHEFSQSILKLAHSRSVSRKKTRRSSPSTIQPNPGQQVQSRFIRRFGARRGGQRSRSRSRVKDVVEDMLRVQRESGTQKEFSTGKSEPRERSLDRVSWNVPKSVILKSDVSEINSRVQANFKNQMKIALEKISVKLVNVGRCRRRRQQTLQNFSTILDLYERYLLTLKRGGRDSRALSGMIETIRRIGGPIKRGVDRGSFDKDLETLNIGSMQKIVDFLTAILEKDLLSLPMACDSGSQKTNNFGTISSNLPSNKYNSQIENTAGARRFGERKNMPVYSSEIFKRNMNASNFNLSMKKISTAAKGDFGKKASVNEELRNFCVVLRYKLDFKIKKRLKMVMGRMKTLPRRFEGRAWKRLPRVFVYLMRRRVVFVIKVLKIFRMQRALDEKKRRKRSTRRKYD